MKRYLIILVMFLFLITNNQGQTIAGEVFDGGGIYGSDVNAHMTVTLTASSQYAINSTSSPTIFVFRIPQAEWDASGITSVTTLDNPLAMGSNSGGPSSEWDDANGYHYLYYSATVADWDLHDCPTSLGPNSTYLSLKFNDLSTPITVYMTLKDVDPVVGSEVNLVFDNQLTSVNSDVIPLTLTSFSAKKHNITSTYLSWTSEDEVNFDRFDIERSTGYNDWEYIATIKGSGKDRGRKSYSYIDKDVYKNEGSQSFYYRLKMVDLDGRYKFSEVREVLFDNANRVIKLLVFPNPASKKVFFTLSDIKKDSKLMIKIYDNAGKLALSKNIVYQNNKNLLIDNTVQRLQAGSYNVIISDEGEHKYFKKLVLTR